MIQRREVVVFDMFSERDNSDAGLIRKSLKVINIATICPICGGPRGRPNLMPFYEAGQVYQVHTWKNPCGHVDYYGSLLCEDALYRAIGSF